MKTYYLIVINIALALFLMSCESESGESPPITFPQLKFINEQNQNLLDTEVVGYYKHDQIAVWTIQDGVKVDGIVDISLRPASTPTVVSCYILGVGLFYTGSLYKEPTEGGDLDFYLSLSETDVDTVTWVISTKFGSPQLSTILYNGKQPEHKELEYYYTVTK